MTNKTYTKVPEGIDFFALDEDFKNQRLYYKVNEEDYWLITDIGGLFEAHQHGEIYCEIEKPEKDWRDTLREELENDDVEWWEDIINADDGCIEIESARLDKEGMRYLWKALGKTFEGEGEHYGDE